MEQESYIPSTPSPTDGGLSVGGGVAAAGATGKIVAAIVAIVVLGGLGAVGWSLGWVGGGPKPEIVLQRMMTAFADVKSAQATVNIDADIRSSLSGSQKLRVAFTSAIDMLDAEHPKGWSTVDMAFPMQGMPLTMKLETRTEDDVSYFQISGLPYELLGPFASLQNQWMKLDTQKLIDTVSILSSLSPMSEGMQIPDYKTLKKKNLELEEKSKTLLRSSTIFKADEVLDDTTIEGVRVYHYRVSFDDAGVKKFLSEYLALSLESLNAFYPAEAAGMNLEEMKQTLEKQLTDAKLKGSGELWIGKKDSLPYKFQFTPEFEPMKIAVEATEFVMTIDGTFKNYGQPVVVEIPAQSLPFEQILSEFLQGFLGAPGGAGLGF